MKIKNTFHLPNEKFVLSTTCRNIIDKITRQFPETTPCSCEKVTQPMKHEWKTFLKNWELKLS